MRKVRTSIKSTLMISVLDLQQIDHLKNLFFENGLFLDIISPENDYLSRFEQYKFECVVISSDKENNQTFEVIDQIRILYPGVIIIVLLKNPTFESIFQFVRYGVDDFLMFPCVWEDIERVLSYYNY